MTPPTAVRTDVVVIGAGIAGASAAWALAAHRSVVLVEMESQPGLHATGRSAALISETSGSPAVCALAAASRAFLAAPPADVADSSLLGPRGLMWVAGRGESHRLDALEQVAARLGVRSERLDTAAARKIVPVVRAGWLDAALYEPDAMSIDVARLLGGFMTGFREAGGEVRMATPALRVERIAGGWCVESNDVTIECTAIVDAAGAWADVVAERAGVTPLGLQPLLRTAFTFPLTGPAAEHESARPHWPLVMDVASRFYFEPEGPGLLASPGDETAVDPCDAQADDLAMAMAADALGEATTLEVRGVRSRWAGLRTFAPDRVPVVGDDPTAPGFFWLAGQGGAGIKTSPALGLLTASLVTGQPVPDDLTRAGVDPAALSPARFR